MPLPNGFTAIKDATGERANVNLLGVVVSLKDAKKTRGTDWILDFEIQDDFTTGLGGSYSTINCRLFRPAQDRLPKMSGPGDVVILRDFKLSAWGLRVDCIGDSMSRLGILVFPANKIPVLGLSQAYQVGTKHLTYVATNGTRAPTTQEEMAVIQLRHAASGSVQQVQQQAVTASFKATKTDKLALIKDLELSRFYDVRVQVVNVYYTSDGTVDLKVTDYTPNRDLFYYADPEENNPYMAMDKTWRGPYGQLTLNVILWESNAAWAREHVSAGDYIFLKNMRTKMSPVNKLEGALHQDRQRPNQIDIRKLINQSDINEIKQRQKEYDNKRRSKSALEVLKDTSKEPPAKAASKKAEKKIQQLAQRAAEQKELEEKALVWAAARGGVNTNIRAAFPEKKLSTISEIRYTPHLDSRSNKYNDFKLPFINARHRARVRVVDVFPPEIELFSHSTKDRKWNRPTKKQDPSDAGTRSRWEWGFVLLLEDAEIPPNTVSEKLRVVVGNDVGQGLLDENASNLKENSRVVKRLEEKLFILWGNLMELKTELRCRGSDLPLPPGDNRLQNKPFDCCIEEYGHEVPISDENPFGYQRMHRLAQTFISS